MREIKGKKRNEKEMKKLEMRKKNIERGEEIE